MEGRLKPPFDSSTPGVPGLPSLPLFLWCLENICTGDVVRLSSHYVSYPSPLPSHDDCVHVTLVASHKRSCWFAMLSSQKTRRILPRFMVWMLDILLSRFWSSSSMLSRIVEWKMHSSVTILAWSWCCIGMNLIRCLAFWKCSWPCCMRRFLTSLPISLSNLTVLPSWMNSSVVGRSSAFYFNRCLDIQHHYLCLLLTDLQAHSLHKYAETGCFLLHVLVSVWDQR